MRAMPHIRWQERRSAPVNARRALPGYVSYYFAYVRRVLAGNPPPRELHQLRLATKRLRYTLELFRPCYGRGLEDRLALLRTVQQRLGDVNDAVAAWDLLANKLGRTAEHERMRKFLADRAEKEAREFRGEWEKLFESPGREQWWGEYLAGTRASRAGKRKQNGPRMDRGAHG